MPHTTATKKQRLDALAKVVEAEPKVGWQLLKTLLPGGGSDISSGTRMPRWREWANGWKRGAYSDYPIAIAKFAIQQAGGDFGRWSDLVPHVFFVSGTTTAKAIDGLEALSKKEDEPKLRSKLWNATRRFLARNPPKENESSEDAFQRLLLVRDALAPSDPILQHSWLFRRGAFHDYFDDSKSDADQRLGVDQVNALREIHDKKGVGGLIEIVATSDQPESTGGFLLQTRL